MNSIESNQDINHEEIDTFRLRINKKIENRIWIIFIVYVGLVILGYNYYYNGSILSTVSILVIFVVVLAYITGKLFIEPLHSSFYEFFKEHAINKLHTRLKAEISPEFDASLKKREVKKSNLFNFFNHFVSGKLVRVNIDNMMVKCSYVKLGYQSRYHTNYYLKGFYSSFNYNLDPDLDIEVVSRHCNKPTMRKIYFKNSHEFKTNNPPFEERYIVYDVNNELTKKFITETFINNLMTLNEKIKRTIFFSIKHGNIQVAFNDPTEHFLKLSMKKDSKQLTQLYLDDMREILDKLLEIKKFFDNTISNHKI